MDSAKFLKTKEGKLMKEANQGINNDRLYLEQIQSQMMQALLCGQDPPPGTCSQELAETAKVLNEKRKRMLERALAALVKELGNDAFSAVYAEYSLKQPASSCGGAESECKRFCSFLRKYKLVQKIEYCLKRLTTKEFSSTNSMQLKDC